MQDTVRIEHDSMGEIAVPADHYWGAQTQRSLEHFSIGPDRMPMAVVRALAQVKQAAATANQQLGALPADKADAIRGVVTEILAGDLDQEFPLSVFQTGSGTQTNANLNEVIANRANERLGADRGSNAPIHPSDDVNMSQSTNDAFVTAMHVAAYTDTAECLLPSLMALRDAIATKATQWADVTKVGRTHLMDATPLTVGQEWSGYAASLAGAIGDVASSSSALLEVALGGTAVGTGINTPPDYTTTAVAALADITGHPYLPASNPFAAQATLDALVRAHGALKGVAVALFKIANDLRWAASGPRAGLAELRIPANEPGSTIMPGKVNPTQAEAMLQVCLAVIGHDTAVAMAGAEGNFELNAFRPVVIDFHLRSCRLLRDSADSLRRHLIEGTALNEPRLRQYVSDSVMVVTALSPLIGYEAAAGVAKAAIDEDLPIREALARKGFDPALADGLTTSATGTGGEPSQS